MSHKLEELETEIHRLEFAAKRNNNLAERHERYHRGLDAGVWLSLALGVLNLLLIIVILTNTWQSKQ